MEHQELFFKAGLSVTSINEFFRSPAHFWRTSSYNPDKEKKAATPAMIFGRLIHSMILTPELVERDFAVTPVAPKGALITVDDIKKFITDVAPVDAEGKPIKFLSLSKPKLLDLMHTNEALLAKQQEAGVVVWDMVMDDFYNRIVGKRDIISLEDKKLAESMRDAMFANEAVRQLVGNGASESPVTWYREADDPDALMCKCKLDYFRTGLVIEYKTTNDTRADELAKTVANMGYHRQIAWQWDAATIIGGQPPRGAIMIFQDKDIHENIAIHPLSAAAIERGAAENAYAYGEIKRRLKAHKSGDSKAWRSHEEKILAPLELPRYYDFKQTIPTQE